jgi:hypothetical protein
VPRVHKSRGHREGTNKDANTVENEGHTGEINTDSLHEHFVAFHVEVNIPKELFASEFRESDEERQMEAVISLPDLISVHFYDESITHVPIVDSGAHALTPSARASISR